MWRRAQKSPFYLLTRDYADVKAQVFRKSEHTKNKFERTGLVVASKTNKLRNTSKGVERRHTFDFHLSGRDCQPRKLAVSILLSSIGKNNEKKIPNLPNQVARSSSHTDISLSAIKSASV